MWKFFHQLASPPHFYRLAAVFSPWFALPGIALITYGVYANAFVPIAQDQNVSCQNTIIRDDAGPRTYLKFAQKWKKQGATIIGGCCGIGPEHIKALHQLNQR